MDKLSRNAFRKKFPREIRWLRNHNPILLDEFFPLQWEDKSEKYKSELVKFAKTGKDKPSTKTKLGHYLGTVTRLNYKHYNKSFHEHLQNLRPDWFVPVGLKNMLKKLPSDLVEYDNTQPWLGVHKPHRFICKIYGDFWKDPCSIQKSWQKGMSGHPEMSRKSVTDQISHPVKNLTTGVVYSSVASAGRATRKSDNEIVSAIKTGGECCGHKWVYCDTFGNELQKKPDKSPPPEASLTKLQKETLLRVLEGRDVRGYISNRTITVLVRRGFLFDVNTLTSMGNRVAENLQRLQK